MAQARDIKKGEYVKRSATAKKTYIRGTYDRVSKKVELTDFDDMNRTIYVKPTSTLYIDFTF